MSKLIIENRSIEITDIEALDLVQQVMRGGRISNDGKQYCYVTTALKGRVHIATDLNKCSDRIVVYDASRGNDSE